jgi:hypothetical protein
MQERKGYITISRKLFEHEFFTEKREYSKFEAWLDLIQVCAFEDNQSMMVKGKIVRWGRGQTIASVRYLQERWYWKSLDKVTCYLKLLRSQKMIIIDTEQGIGRITLCKYDDYNPKAYSKPDSDRTDTRQRPNKIKELNKDNKDKEREARAKSFYDSLVPHLEKYGKEMLREFYNYWSEWNRSQTKMKWELKETWEVSKRLATWAKRDDNFKGDTQPQTKQNTKIKVK